MRENRWTVDEVRCLDCGATFEIDDVLVDRDVPRPDPGALRFRALMIKLPVACPECHNLKPVKEPECTDKPDPSSPATEPNTPS